MDMIKLLQDEILKLRMNNKQPKCIYVGDFEYRELKKINAMTSTEYKDEFMGIEVIRVSRNNHVNITD